MALLLAILWPAASSGYVVAEQAPGLMADTPCRTGAVDRSRVEGVRELLLLSNSTAPGMGFLEHATRAIRGVLGDRTRLLFVPFASRDPDAYTGVMRQALAPASIEVTSLHQASDPAAAVADAQAVFVGGGNSFRLLRALNTLGVLEALRQAARAGVPYLAASAGADLACPTIRTNDMPIAEPARWRHLT